VKLHLAVAELGDGAPARLGGSICARDLTWLRRFAEGTLYVGVAGLLSTTSHLPRHVVGTTLQRVDQGPCRGHRPLRRNSLRGAWQARPEDTALSSCLLPRRISPIAIKSAEPFDKYAAEISR
jgi:hypothetical protein